jgi:hypothetical protein
VIWPSKSARNFIPTSIALFSSPSATLGAAKSKSVARGVTGSEAADALPVPTAFFAATRNA